MSDPLPRRRIQAQASGADPEVMGFTLDAEVQPGKSARWEGPEDAPLAQALFALTGVTRVEVRDVTIWVQKTPDVDWAVLKPAIATAIRQVLDETDAPLGGNGDGRAEDPDAALLRAVEDLLERQVNPSVAAHGGRIDVERVDGSTVFLRMSGGCQGCAASSATLRQGVEQMLRAALPQITQIVDVTDHASGDTPFYARGDGTSPMLNRMVPADAIAWEDGQITLDPAYLAPRLGLSPNALREGFRSGAVVGVTETGEGSDAGKTRIVIRSAGRSWAAEVGPDGAAREIPPPRLIEASADKEKSLARQVREHLASLAPDSVPITYGALARDLGFWMPGSIRRITAALESTMREDADACRPFIAARVVSRVGGLPGKGFFDLAYTLSRGPQAAQSEEAFHGTELKQLEEVLIGHPTEIPQADPAIR